ncbi:MAG: (Fe-S)-binding protein [Leadbetterella sp.]
MKVALFIPCYIDQFYPEVAKSTLRILERFGCEVDFPLDQTCCGQPMANSGYEHLAEGCEKNFKSCFDSYEYVVCPSGSCALHVKDHMDIRSKIYELVEFLTDVLKISTVQGHFEAKIGFHQSCHGQRGLYLSQMSELHAQPFSKPLQLLSGISGLEIKTLNRPDECCGFGGTFCVTEEAVSVRMGKDRIQDHLSQEVDIICGGDSSCLMHLEGIIRREKHPLKTLHIAEIIDKAMDLEANK